MPVGRLADLLAVSTSHISQVRSGERRIPIDWMPVLEVESGGRLNIVQLVLEQSKGVVAARRQRVARRIAMARETVEVDDTFARRAISV